MLAMIPPPTRSPQETPPRVPGPPFTALPTDTLGEVFALLDGVDASAFATTATQVGTETPEVQRARLFTTYGVVADEKASAKELQQLLRPRIRLAQQTQTLLERLGRSAKGMQEMHSLKELTKALHVRNSRAGEPVSEARVAELYQATCSGSALFRLDAWVAAHNKVTRENFATHMERHFSNAGGRVVSAKELDVLWATLREIKALDECELPMSFGPLRFTFARDGGPMFEHELAAVLPTSVADDLRAPVATYLRAHRKDYQPLPDAYDGTKAVALPALTPAALAELAPRFVAGDLEEWVDRGLHVNEEDWLRRPGASRDVLQGAATTLLADYEERKLGARTPEDKLRNVATLYRELLIRAPFGAGTGVFLRAVLVPLLLAQNDLPMNVPKSSPLGSVAELMSELADG